MWIRFGPLPWDLFDLELYLAKDLEAYSDPLRLSWLGVGKLQQTGVCRPERPFHNDANNGSRHSCLREKILNL